MTPTDPPRSGILDVLGDHRIVPVVVLDDAAAAGPLADALVAGGLPVAEITLRTPAALDAIRRMADRDLVLGVGSARTADDVERAVDAGARFVVSAGFADAVAERCDAMAVPYLPGVATPTEVIRGLAAGLDVLKFFPAAVLGGPSALAAIASPFPGVGFVPTGGIGVDDVARYLSLPAVRAVGGSWMVAPGLIRDGRFDTITSLAAAAVAAARRARP